MIDNNMKILVCGPAWVGDMVMAQSLFNKIRKNQPAAAIDVLAPAWSVPLIRRMPEVDHAIELPVGHGQLKLGQRLSIAKRLAKNSYDQAIVCQRSWKAALIPFFARIPIRTGYRGQMRYPLINDQRKLDKKKLPRTVDRLVAMGCDETADQPPAFENPSLCVNQANREAICSKLGLDLNRPAAAFFPGAEYGPAKQWPLDYFRQLAEKLINAGWQIWLMGSPKDIECSHHITDGRTPHIHDLIGKTRLADAIDIISLCNTTVTNDSGLMHVAAAVGTHVEALYGSSTPDYTPPLTDRKTIHYLRLSCSPCFERRCPLGHKNCLNQITPDTVAASILLDIQGS